VLDDLGLIPALNTLLKNFSEETSIRVSLSAVAAVEQVDGDKSTVLYRVAQEALTNIVRHAHASRADVKIQKLDDAICMTIKDDGKGFRHEHVLHGKKKNRLGLLGMRERVQMVRGSFVVHSAPGKGTTIRVQIPFAEVPRRGEGLFQSLPGTKL
jgi:two-component system, NarL family, sensor histidine kinase DegS